jgi:hypothetical protein
MTEVLNPVEIEHRIRDVSERISRGVRICSDTYREFMRLDGEYDRAFARAYLAHNGPAHEKKPAAELATEAERTARDIADVTYRHAKDTADALREELRAWQSVGASIRAMYAVAGRGEGA